MDTDKSPTILLWCIGLEWKTHGFLVLWSMNGKSGVLIVGAQ